MKTLLTITPLRRPRFTRAGTLLLVGAVLVLLLNSAAAQTQCPLVEDIGYPVDGFQLAQDFGVPSYRHQGRYHTGEDWFAGAGVTAGQPVQAIAAGRVTYSAPNGWGRDGGAVIIEHTFADGSVYYSMYGHIVEQGDIRFPARLSCVVRGQVIGAIADVRPAPHVHWEMRSGGPDVPGPGYEWDDPLTQDYLSPSKFVTNWQAWLADAHRWHVTFSDAPARVIAPLRLNDDSLLAARGGLLRRVLPDGRILWRVDLGQPIVGLFGRQGEAWVFLADGTASRVDPGDGSSLGRWAVREPLDVLVLAADAGAGAFPVFRTPDGALLAVDMTRQTTLWRLPLGLPDVLRAVTNGRGAALLTTDARLWSVALSEGRLLDTAQMRGVPGVARGTPDALMIYTRTGLWAVNPDGSWIPFPTSAGAPLDAAPVLTDGAAARGAADEVYLYDGGTLRAYAADGARLWETPVTTHGVPDLLAAPDGRLLLATTGGDLVLLSAATGAVCRTLRVWEGERLWLDLGDDDTLRVALGDQLLGVNWAVFARGCA